MKKIVVGPDASKRWFNRGKNLMVRAPGLLIMAVILLLFLGDPLWPYHWLQSSWVKGFMSFLIDSAYRDKWIANYGVLTFALVASGICMAIGLKLGVWNRVFKRLVLRHGVEGELHERDIGRVYWIQRWGGMNAWKKVSRTFIRTMRALHIADIHVLRYRTLKDTRRTIYYHDHFGIINPFNPAKSMRRLVSEVSDRAIEVQDSTTMTVTGKFLDREMEGFYPTFVISEEAQHIADIDIQHYNETFNDEMIEGSITTRDASEMDSSIMKDQKKYQEVSVSPDRILLERYEESRRAKTDAGAK